MNPEDGIVDTFASNVKTTRLKLAQQIENETDDSAHSENIEALINELEQQLNIVLKNVEPKLAE